MPEINTTNIGFEKQIWDAACVLRGNIDASEYKSVVLGLIFLKYISDRFEAKYQELLAEGDGFEEDIDEYTAENIFFVPENARWSVISSAAHTPEIGTVIDEAMRSIEKENKRLKDILPKNFARPELDKRRLGEVVDLFTNIQMIEHGNSKDILGRTYEYCLSKFAEQEGKLAGEFYTPSCVVRTLVEVLQPYNGRVYDPCCGSGGMFVQSAKFVENHGGNINKISVFGQDSNPTTWKMAQMNLAIRGIEADLGKFNADTFFNDCHPQLKADFIMANPPFNLSGWGQDKLLDDVRWQYGTPPAGNANFAWLQHMIWHLAPNGRIGMVLANGSLSSQSGGEGEIRKNIINADLVDCIIAMPTQLFYTTQIPVSKYIEAIFNLRKSKEDESSCANFWFFRGQKCSLWSMRPSVFRGNALGAEFDMIQRALRQRPFDFRDCTTDFEILTKLQHYGLGTRLLDVTLNPLVALYFASEPFEDIEYGKDNRGKKVFRDGKIVFHYGYGHKLSELNIRIACAIPFLDFDNTTTLSKLCALLRGHSVISADEEGYLRDNDFKKMIEAVQASHYVISSYSNERLIRQSGSFIVPTAIKIVENQTNIGDSLIRKSY